MIIYCIILKESFVYCRASGNAIHQSEMKTTILTVIIAIISLIIFLPMAFTYTIFLVKANMPSPDISVRPDNLNINLLSLRVLLRMLP